MRSRRTTGSRRADCAVNASSAYDTLVTASGRSVRWRLAVSWEGLPVTVPQFGIFAQGTIAHAFVEWDLRPDVDLSEVARVLARLRGPTVSAGGVNLVVAFGSELSRAL